MNTEATDLRGELVLIPLHEINIGTVIAVPRVNLSNPWNYSDWTGGGWNLYTVEHFGVDGSIILQHTTNIDDQVTNQDRVTVSIPGGSTGNVHAVPPEGGIIRPPNCDPRDGVRNTHRIWRTGAERGRSHLECPGKRRQLR